MKTSLSKKINEGFNTFASHVTNLLGNVWVCLLAVAIIVTWVVIGFMYGFTEFWQSILDIGITIITFIMVFIIQHTQNRDSTILNLKVNEIIRALEKASNSTIDLHNLSDEKLMVIEENYKQKAKGDEVKQTEKAM